MGGEVVINQSLRNSQDFIQAWQFREYVRDIESLTGRMLSSEQIKRLGNAIKFNKYVELNEAEKILHRVAFDNKRLDLIAHWEQITGEKWPKYDKCVLDKNGKVMRKPNSLYDAHEIIPNSYGGPLEWWNIHPVRWPNEHQGGIHGASGILRRILN